MGYFDIYKNRVQHNGSGYAERQRNNIAKDMVRKFKKSPSYYDIDIKDLSNSITTKGVQIYDNNSLSKLASTNLRFITMQPGDILECGYVINHEDKDWICIKKDNLITDKGVMQECNNTLKWRSGSTIIEIPCVSSNMSLYSIGLYENKYYAEEDGKKYCVVAHNESASVLNVGMRFIFDHEDAFIITEIFRDIKGILQIKMQQTKVQTEDDLLNNLAYNGVIQPTQPSTDTGWTFEIIGENEIIEGTSKEYLVKIWHNGIEDTNQSQTCIWELESVSPTIAYLSGNVVSRNITVNGVDGTNYITLKAALSVDNSKIQRKIITIKSLF